ncbi:hypothetical protein V8G54_020278 [Vigna mungo]|uniref:Uncharacterized protein n=1 Tax=Vigna mungo TaxID=3915 RepID=A0AAQ3RUJ9_VIGMU
MPLNFPVLHCTSSKRCIKFNSFNGCCSSFILTCILSNPEVNIIKISPSFALCCLQDDVRISHVEFPIFRSGQWNWLKILNPPYFSSYFLTNSLECWIQHFCSTRHG